MKTGVEKDIFWSETESGFREPGAVHPHQDIYIMIFHLHFPPRSTSSVLCSVGQHSSSSITHDLTEQSAFATRAAFVLEFL